MHPTFDPDKQHTIALPINISGSGLHSGLFSEMTLKPAIPGYGFHFQRTDLPGKPIIKADCDLVIDTFRSTTLAFQGATISSVEHILAALVGMGVDNCLIQVRGAEIPTIDGSCETFVRLIEKAGLLEQEAVKNWVLIEEDITLYDVGKRVRMTAFPSMEHKISVMVDFKNSDLKMQTAELRTLRDFKNQIAPCRTYCFVHDLEMLLNHNRVQGDIAHNALLLIDQPMEKNELSRLAKKFKINKCKVLKGGYLNNLALRFENEIARHKLMDVIGDMALIGFPIKAQIIGKRPGHSTNVDFAKKIKQFIQENKKAEHLGKAV